MKSKHYNTIFFIIGLLTLAYIVHKLGVDVIWQNLQQTGVWFVPVIFIWLIIYILNAWAFWEIIHEKHLPHTKLPFLTVLKVTISGYAINYITPFIALGGEPYRIMELKEKVGTNKATSSVLLYNIMHMYSHIVFWMLSVICIVIFMQPKGIALVACIVVFLIFFGMLYWIVAQYKKGLIKVTLNFLARLPFVKNKVLLFSVKRSKNIEEIDQQMIELFTTRLPTFYASLALEFVARVIGCFEIYFVGIALQSNMSVLDAFIISAESSLFANMIFFSPMQLGAREGGFILALKSLGMNPAHGIFISLVSRIRELVWIAAGLILMKLRPAPKAIKTVI